MKYSTVVFDFDGTIADTRALMFEVANALAAEFGYDPIREEEIPKLRQMSARELLVRRLHIPLWNFVKIYRLEKKGKALFAERATDVHVFTGIREVINDLRKAGCRVGIVTSNLHDVVSVVLVAAAIAVDFVQAGSSVLGKDRAITHALAVQKIDPATVVYVGDELRDVKACKKVGIAMIGVAWGYNDADALQKAGVDVVSNTEQLQQLLISEGN